MLEFYLVVPFLIVIFQFCHYDLWLPFPHPFSSGLYSKMCRLWTACSPAPNGEHWFSLLSAVRSKQPITRYLTGCCVEASITVQTTVRSVLVSLKSVTEVFLCLFHSYFQGHTEGWIKDNTEHVQHLQNTGIITDYIL